MSSSPCQRVVTFGPLAPTGRAWKWHGLLYSYRQRASVPHPGPAVQAAAETETGTAAAAPIAEPECHPSGSAMAAGAACNPVPAVIEITDMPDGLHRKKKSDAA